MDSPDATARYTDVIRHMTPERKMATSRELWRTAWVLKAAGIRMLEPALSEDEVQRRVREIFLRAAS